LLVGLTKRLPWWTWEIAYDWLPAPEAMEAAAVEAVEAVAEVVEAVEGMVEAGGNRHTSRQLTGGAHQIASRTR
jgi:hypothetical protein